MLMSISCMNRLKGDLSDSYNCLSLSLAASPKPPEFLGSDRTRLGHGGVMPKLLLEKFTHSYGVGINSIFVTAAETAPNFHSEGTDAAL